VKKCDQIFPLAAFNVFLSSQAWAVQITDHRLDLFFITPQASSRNPPSFCTDCSSSKNRTIAPRASTGYQKPTNKSGAAFQK